MWNTQVIVNHYRVVNSDFLFNSSTRPSRASPWPHLLQVEEAYKNVDLLCRLLVCTLGMSADKPLVAPALDLCKLVDPYQQPPVTARHISHHQDAPQLPLLPLEDYRLEQSLQGCSFVLSLHELHIKSLQIIFKTAQKIKEANQNWPHPGSERLAPFVACLRQLIWLRES